MSNLEKLGASVDALMTAANDSHAVDVQVIADLQALSKDIADLKAQVGTDIQPAIDALQAKVDGAVGALTADKQALSDAVAANPA